VRMTTTHGGPHQREAATLPAARCPRRMCHL
jgi:hypothetical protein